MKTTERDCEKEESRAVPTLVLLSDDRTGVVLVTEHDLAKARMSGAAPDAPVSRWSHPCERLKLVEPDVSLLEAARLMLGAEFAVVPAEEASDLPAMLSIRRGR